MKSPRIIEFIDNNAFVLMQSFKTVRPYEGCALLIGKKNLSDNDQNERCWQINLIWPCCNVWVPNNMDYMLKPNAQTQSNYSRENRFQIDPKEQILAQKWSRSHQLQVLGSAHSHPNSSGIPSSIDIHWNLNSGLMLIVDQFNFIKAWWISSHRKFQEIEVTFSINNKESKDTLIPQ